MTSPTRQHCVWHSDRPAFARCMGCAKMLCQECATQWDGIWHCAACLARTRQGTARRSGAWSWIAAVAGSLILLFLTARLMVWTSAVIAGLF